MSVVTEIVVIFVLILANGFLAMSEMSLASARKVRLKQMADDGNKKAATALALAEEPTRFLSTVQIGITLINILTGTFGGASLSARLAPLIAQIDVLAPWSNAIAVVIVIALITYFTLILGELVPKRLALNNSEKLAVMVAPIVHAISRAAAPIERLLSASTDAVVRLLGMNRSEDESVTDEEVRILLEQGAESGYFEPIEEEIVEQLFRLSDLSVDALITPRTDVEWLDVNDTSAELSTQLQHHTHSRYPVGDGDLDNVVGLVLVKDLFAAALSGAPIDLRAVMQQPLFIPDSMPALEALERLRQTRTHIALVIDEYGGLEGIVTLADFVEAIIGEVPDTYDDPDPDIVQRADGSYLLDGMLAIDRFQQLMEVKNMPEDSEGYYQTLGGFVMSMLGRVPTAGDSFDWQNMRLEVLDMDGRRVDKVLVSFLDGET
jgi:putative hemolysin